MSLEIALAKERVALRGGITRSGFVVAAPAPSLPKPGPTPSLVTPETPAGDVRRMPVLGPVGPAVQLVSPLAGSVLRGAASGIFQEEAEGRFER